MLDSLSIVKFSANENWHNAYPYIAHYWAHVRVIVPALPALSGQCNGWSYANLESLQTLWILLRDDRLAIRRKIKIAPVLAQLRVYLLNIVPYMSMHLTSFYCFLESYAPPTLTSKVKWSKTIHPLKGSLRGKKCLPPSGIENIDNGRPNLVYGKAGSKTYC